MLAVGAASGFHVFPHRVGGALADLHTTDIDTAHARLRGEGHEAGLRTADRPPPQIEALLRQYDDAAPLRRLIRQRSQLCRIGQFLLRDAIHWKERTGLPVAQRDGARLVEHEDVNIPGGLDGAPAHRQHIRLVQAAHAGDTDCR